MLPLCAHIFCSFFPLSDILASVDFSFFLGQFTTTLNWAGLIPLRLGLGFLCILCYRKHGGSFILRMIL